MTFINNILEDETISVKCEELCFIVTEGVKTLPKKYYDINV